MVAKKDNFVCFEDEDDVGYKVTKFY